MRVTAVALVAVFCMVLLLACRSSADPSVTDGEPAPILQLAGVASAYRAEQPPDRLAGYGSDEQPGDYVLENAFVRFVVASIHHGLESGHGGCVIDAALQGGRDRMRLLQPLLGTDRLVRPLYTSLDIAEPGGLDAAAVVRVAGHLPGYKGVNVNTTYTLYPGEVMLEIATAVEHAGRQPMPGFQFGDYLCHGRTRRYAAGDGLKPLGQGSSSRWFAFYDERYAWGVLPPPAGMVQADHGAGHSDLVYLSQDLPPGHSRTYTRWLVAVEGGTEAVWLMTKPVSSAVRSRLFVELVDEHDGSPVGEATVAVTGAEANDSFVVKPGADGRADFALPAGRYRLQAAAPGRPTTSALTVTCAAGMSHRLGLRMLPASGVEAEVKVTVGDYAMPGPARVTAFSAGRATPPVWTPASFPARPPEGTLLSGGQWGSFLPLPPATSGLPGSYLLAAARGPQYSAAVTPVRVPLGERLSPPLRLRRLIRIGDYVSVDFRQHTSASPDCALSPAERIYANACEGLDAGFAVDPIWRDPTGELDLNGESLMLPGMRLDCEGLGSFSALPSTSGPPERAGPTVRRNRTARQVLHWMRQALPDSLIQVNRPMSPRNGYFTLAGFGGPHKIPEGFCTDFDALELLTGSHVSETPRVMQCWFALLNAGHRVIATGASGSRGIAGSEANGARTFVHCPTRGGRPTPDEVLRAVRRLREQPNAIVSNGPFIEAALNGEPIGSTQTWPEPTAVLSLRVQAAEWVDVSRVMVFHNGLLLEEFEVEPAQDVLRVDRSLTLPVRGDGWFVVVAEGDLAMLPFSFSAGDEVTPFAATNPFWVDADGDGKVNVPGRASSP